MAYVPGFKVDVFISYPMEAEEWARQFDKVLTETLRFRIKNAEIYLARRNWRGVANEMLEHARGAVLFLAIITRGALEDTGTTRFQEVEAKAFRESRPEGYRFIPILLNAVLERDVSKLFPLEGSNDFHKLFPFFYQDEDGHDLTLWPGEEPTPGEYRKRIAQLAYVIADKLRKCRPKPKGPFTDLTVLLAPMEPDVDEPDLADKWSEIRELLVNDGVTILPQQEYSGDDTAVAKALQTDLQKAHMFVQLLSLQKWERAKLQFVAAQRSAWELPASTRKFPVVMQWRTGMNSELIEGRPPDDKALLGGPRTFAIRFQEFKNELRKELAGILNDITNVGKSPPPSPTKPYIYITADTPDLTAASKLQIAGRRKGAYPCVMSEGEERLQDFSEALECSNAVVFLYGGTKANFINLWLSRYVRKINEEEIRAARQKRGLEPELETVLYDAPPENPQGQIMPPFDPLPRLGSRQELVVEDFERLCDELARVRATKLARTGAAEQGRDGV